MSLACSFALLGDAAYWRARNPGLPVAEIDVSRRGRCGLRHGTSRPSSSACRAPEARRHRGRHGAAGDRRHRRGGGHGLPPRGAAPSSPTRSRRRRSMAPASGIQGHTDYLAHLSARHGEPVQEVMMLVADDLRAIPVTVHIPLKDVPTQLTRNVDHRPGARHGARSDALFRHCPAAPGLHRPQPACRRERRHGPRGDRCDPPRTGQAPRRGPRRQRPALGRHRLPPGGARHL